MARTLAALFALALLTVCGCAQGNGNPKSSSAEARPAQPASAPAVAAYPGGSAPKIDAQRAMKYVREVVAFGPRPIASPAHKRLEDYILAQLKGDQLDSD